MSSPVSPSPDAGRPAYQKPPTLIAKVVNPTLIFVTERLGLAPGGLEILAVRGRTSGQTRKVPVNLLSFDGQWYLFSPRGNSEWVRNLRAAGEGELARGGNVRHFVVAEDLPDAAKPPVIRAYMQKWAKQVSSVVGFGADASDETLAASAPNHPIFRIEMRPTA
ncbi:MAG: nitroreductase family deazaflavin-dependent oxidoreductase [Thermomicrobiales bacterium]